MGWRDDDLMRRAAGGGVLNLPALSVRWVASADEIDVDLWEQCFPPPLEGKWWYEALQRSGLQDQFKFLYGIVERDTQPIAIAPAFVMNVPIDLVAPKPIAVALRSVGRLIPSLQYQRTFFIGSPCADEGTVGTVAGTSIGDVADAIRLAALERAKAFRAPMLVWKDFLARDAGSVLGCDARQFLITSYPGTRIELSGVSSFEAYLAGLSGSHRHNLKKKLKRGRAALPVDIEIKQKPSPGELHEVFELFMQTYEKGTTKFERLTPAFFEQIALAEASHFILLRAKDDGRLVAFMLAFAMGEHAINKFIGLDYARAGGEAFLYFQLWEAFARWATDRSATTLQSGQTGYRAKLDVGHSLVPLFNVCRHRNPIVNKIFALATKNVDWSSLDLDLATYLIAHPEADQSTLT